MVDLLHKVGRWLAEEGLIEGWRVPAKWKERLKEEWSQITEAPTPRPNRDRFSGEELASLVTNHGHPELHPKASLLFELTWGRRIQQVSKTMRSMVEIAED